MPPPSPLLLLQHCIENGNHGTPKQKNGPGPAEGLARYQKFNLQKMFVTVKQENFLQKDYFNMFGTYKILQEEFNKL